MNSLLRDIEIKIEMTEPNLENHIIMNLGYFKLLTISSPQRHVELNPRRRAITIKATV